MSTLGVVTGHPLGDVLQRVERRGDLEARGVVAGNRRAAGQRSAEDERADPTALRSALAEKRTPPCGPDSNPVYWQP